MKKMIRAFAPLFATFLVLPTAVSLTSCDESATGFKKNVLRIASWDEYIDLGGEDSYAGENSRAIYEEFEDWYKEKTGKKITVEYIPLQDNETMYNKIKMGDKYDLLCPSEYMIMKLKSENRLEKFPEEFFDATIEENYYSRFCSEFISKVFERNDFDEYAAGYMWGTTGFVYNADKVSADSVKTWKAFTSKTFTKKITCKDNVRDAYFAGLGLYYEDELLDLKAQLDAGTIELEDYQAVLAGKMNDTNDKTVASVKKCLEKMRKNLYGLETDEGKTDVFTGRIPVSYQWSGDAAYIIEEAEGYGLTYEYAIPEAASNLWFDGWVMMKGANVDAATAFINYVSRPDNAVRNMDYIGYTSCTAGKEVFDYLKECYQEDEGTTVDYDLSYFFDPQGTSGNNYSLSVAPEQTRGKLFAQYPDVETVKRCVVMRFFDKNTNVLVNRMWNNIK